MKGFKYCIVISILLLLFLFGCASRGSENFWNDLKNVEKIDTDENDKESEYADPDDGEKKDSLSEKRTEAINALDWDQSIYEGYIRLDYPEVNIKNEYPLKGSLWFPAVNNIEEIKDIAPVIPYDMALRLYLRYAEYPDDPKNYTAKALNENCFPINFMRKCNDRMYYTACRVEDKGYLFFFFCNGENLDITAKELADNNKTFYDFENADVSGIDMTEALVWRGCIFLSGNVDDNALLADKLYAVNNNYNMRNGSDLSVICAEYNDLRFTIDALEYQCELMKNTDKSTEDALRGMGIVREENMLPVFPCALLTPEGCLCAQFTYKLDDSGKIRWFFSGGECGGNTVSISVGDYTERNTWPCRLIDIDG